MQRSMRTFSHFVLLIALPLSIAACHDGLGIPDGQGRGTPDGSVQPDGGGAPLACSQITDPTTCEARPDCQAITCPACDNKASFHCDKKGGFPPGECPSVHCPPQQDCSQHHDDASCSADPSCYSVFLDPGTCDCSIPGCCEQFNHCALGPPQCSPTAPCPQLPHDCGAKFAPVYNGGCQIGCVEVPVCPGDCRTNGCPAGDTCGACFNPADWICIPDGAVC
jgi:hypothetical protein